MNTGGHGYYEIVITNLNFTDQPTIILPYIANTVLFILDSLTDTIQFSFNGRSVMGRMNWDDESLVLSGAEIGKLWFKTNNPTGTPLRIYTEA